MQNTALLLLGFTLLAVVTAGAEDHRPVISLDGSWQFRALEPESEWTRLKVPGHWDLAGFTTPDWGGNQPGRAIYRREFEIPAAWKNKDTFLCFGGVNYLTTVRIDGQEVVRYHRQHKIRLPASAGGGGSCCRTIS